MQVFYTDIFELPLPPEHRFPMAKYRLLRERLLADGAVHPHQLSVPPAATNEQLLRVHTAEYLTNVVGGTLDRASVRRLGFPWSPELVERSRRSTGATLAACRAALGERVGVNLAGGTHHAHAGRGGGYCVFNDVAVAVRVLQAEQLIERAVVVDCDVHQGDGTAAIFAADPTVRTLSVHGERNYPFRKQASDIDIALPDGTADAVYLDAVRDGLDRLLTGPPPDLAAYVAGADPHRRDRLGRLSVTKDGLRRRDRLVLESLTRCGVPVAIVMAGGYGTVEDIVDIHATTVTTAGDYHGAADGGRAR